MLPMALNGPIIFLTIAANSLEWAQYYYFAAAANGLEWAHYFFNKCCQ
jgi:hypothetical protein